MYSIFDYICSVFYIIEKMYQKGLTDNEITILKALAYCNIPLSSREIAKILERRMPVADILRDYNSLRSKGLLVNKGADTVLRPDLTLPALVDALKDEGFTVIISEISKYELGQRYTSYRHLRDLIVKHYRNDNKSIEITRADASFRLPDYFELLAPVAGVEEFNWLFQTFGERNMYSLLNLKLLDIHADLLPMEQIYRFEQKLRDVPGLVVTGNSSRLILASSLFLNGQFEQMETYNARLPEQYRKTLMTTGVYMLYKDDAATAFRLMYQTMASKKRTEMFVNYEIYYAAYYILSLLGMNAEQYTPEVQRMLAKKGYSFNYAAIIASAMMYHATDDKKNAEESMSRAEYFSTSVSSLDLIFMYIAACFTETKLTSRLLSTGETLLEKATANGYKLLALELAFSLSKIYQNQEFEDRYKALSNELKLHSVLSRRTRLESWEIALNNLLGVMQVVSPTGNRQKAAKETRIIYYVDPVKKIIQPTLQTSLASGNWSKGRNIALKKLKTLDVEGMTEQDHRIAATLKVDSSYWGGGGYVYFSDDVWPALAGHPYLFMSSNPDIPVELIRAQPELTVEETQKGLALKTDIDPGDAKFVIQKETNTRYKLISIDARQRTILQAIHKGTMDVPAEGKEKLMQVLEHLGGFFTIHSDLIETRQGTRTIESDPRIRVQLLPLGNSLKAELFVKPFGSVPPYCKPGVGGQNIIGMVGDERCHATRDLKTETRYSEAIIREIQQNTSIDASQEPIVFDDPRDSLFLLDVLSRHQDIAIVEWPEGARFKVNKSVSMKNLNLEVKGIDYWFEMDGNLQVDEDTVLSLKQLLELNARSHGRFIELGEGEFLALSNDLKKRLDELQAYTDISGEHARMSRFASLPLMEIFGQAGSFKGDQKWADFRKQLEAVEKIQPVVPKTLKAELRPYQEEGFCWMVRLSEWGAGACLADDMGLGKTVQALAILLHRAKTGAALVVCPASVVSNWVSETNRFAPTLNVLLLTHDNRRETLEKADAFDLVITTYGLLQSEEKLFAGEKWATVVLDEAHVIKNYQTKTSKAAMNLDADFRLAMTGTPVQNHLGEVWNLFHFINPGLLGTMQRFNERFVKTADQSDKRLKKLVSPFILRRTKNNVLEELPPKTEITTKVELTDEERVFYEAIRRQAIENLQQATGPAGQQHVRALAEITRLRLACCHPALVEPNVSISSSKLATFMDIVDDLRSNNHRALVFSQFVKHLAIIRQELDEKKIKYKYLDGATPLAERERNVRDFQSGDGELFLISLKAGGLGLNLTAADYVIHLDPWWNPAIEDQASDRAHRIGQKRPITIYRLVSQHTIEEKIIQLHRTKRDIADSLLEGSDAPAKLSTDELLKLIMEE